MPALPHGGVSGLQVVAGQGGVKQRQVAALRVQVVFERLQAGRVTGQFNGALHILIGLIDGEFLHERCAPWPLAGVQQGVRDAAGETAPVAAEHGQPHPQGIGGGGVGIDRKGVQKQVSPGVPGQVLGGGHAGGKQQASRFHAVSSSLLAQVVFDPMVGLEQPQHAACGAEQNLHPLGKHIGGDFVAVVEAGKHKALCAAATLGQAQRLAAGRRRPHFACGVVGLVTVRQAHQVFAVVRAVFGGDDMRISDQVVHVGRTRSAGIAQVADLNGAGPVGENAQAVMAGKTLDVHADVDLLRMQPLRHLQIAERGDVLEMLHRVANAVVHGVLQWTPGQGKDFKLAFVMQGQHLGQQHRCGVVAKIVGHIGHFDARVCPALALPQGLRRARVAIGHQGTGAAKVFGRVVAEAQKFKWKSGLLPLVQSLLQGLGLRRIVTPISHQATGVGQAPWHIGCQVVLTGSALQPAPQMLGGLVIALGAMQKPGQVFQCVGVKRLVLEGLLKISHGFFIASHAREHGTQGVEDFRAAGGQLTGLLKSGERLRAIEAFVAMQLRPQSEQGLSLCEGGGIQRGQRLG